jgi:DNA-binding transcriptional MocR family regulator
VARRSEGVAGSAVREILAVTQRPGVISFAGGLPAPELFDAEGLRLAFECVLAGEDRRRALQYSTTEGDPALRELLAGRLTTRGLPSRADDLVVTTGSQQALALVASALTDPGAVVLVQEPTYLAAIQCFRLAGARLVAVPSDDGGIDPERLEQVVRRERPSLAYLVTNFANPTGHTLGQARREAVARLSEEHGFCVVEDDPYGELRYSGEHLEPLAAIPGIADRAVYVGSFSKIGAPGLRVGWLRAPASARQAVVVAKQAADLHTSTVVQAAVREYLQHADIASHIRSLCAEYALRLDAMLGALAGSMPAGTLWSEPLGGMFVWAKLPGAVDTVELLPRALGSDVAFVPGAAFYVGEPDRATLRLSFVTHTPEEIADGIGRLARLVG